ncbi:SDA1-domain-containing protein [Lipomyces japonicus]|uniref:SDA1-domain-containing protein n=1 Tax=Lipomyces japonicus TaxID=56871 RepID=UPI0034CFAE64
MPKRRRAALLPNNIALLQNLVRRDPGSYKEEFLTQYRHYETQREILSVNPAGFHDVESFMDQVGFIAQVTVCYPVETNKFADDLAGLLAQHHVNLPADLRQKIVQSLVLMRNRGVISSERLIQVLFPLLPVATSKQFRKDIYTTLVRLLKHANKGSKAPKLNKAVQALLFTLLESTDGPTAATAAADGLWAAKLTRELWRRSIWDDPRSVEIMKTASLHGNPKVAVAGVSFFLGADREREKTTKKKRGVHGSDDDSDEYDDSDDDNSSDDDGAGGAGGSISRPEVAGLKHRLGVNKKSGKRARKLESAMKMLKKKESRKAGDVPASHLNFSAIHLLHDPQGFAERLFTQHLSSRNNNSNAGGGGGKLTLEQRIKVLNLVTRLIGTHKLTVLPVYSFLLKFLTPKQRDVTQFMACAAQATHDLVPPDAISPVIRKIADEFVSDGVAAEVAAAGLNTIREILTRHPIAIEPDLLQDLTEYKGSKSKPVMMAARSLIGFYRDVAPEMLARKDRGKVASMDMASAGADRKTLKYGVENVVEGIPGLELLSQWRRDQGLDGKQSEDADGQDGQGADEEDGWDVQQVNSEDEGWINVESDKEYDVDDKDNDDDDEDEDEDDDDDDEDDEDAENPAKKVKTAEEITQSIMATKVLTPADFQKLDELRTQAGLSKIMGDRGNTNESAVTAENLVTKTRAGIKADKQARLESIMEGRKDRPEFGSQKGKKKDAAPHSTTNREKARKKNFIMMIHKRDVQGKNKRSLRDKQKVLRAHIDKQKKTKKH